VFARALFSGSVHRFDKVLGIMPRMHRDANDTYVVVLSVHGLKPSRSFEKEKMDSANAHATMKNIQSPARMISPMRRRPARSL